MLANLALDGLEQRLREKYPQRGKGSEKGRYVGVHLIRYADGTPVQMSNLRGASPLIPIVRSGI